MNHVYKSVLLLGASVLFFLHFSTSQAQSQAQCIYEDFPGFTVEAGETWTEPLQCSTYAYPYYHALYFRNQVGLRCREDLNSKTSVNLVCSNRASSDRSVRTITMACCKEPRF